MSTFDLQHSAMSIPAGTAAEKHVLLVLALRADNVTRECKPGIPRIAKDTGLSERHVHRAIVELERAKHITRIVKPGIGTIYTVHPCLSVTPDNVSPLTLSHETPDTVSSKLPRTSTSQKTSSSSKDRARMKLAMPDDFNPVATGKTAAVVAGWPPGRMETEIEAMADWHAKEGKLSADWQASWRTWVRNATKWDSRNRLSQRTERMGGHHVASASRGRTVDGFTAALREAAAHSGADKYGRG